MKILLAEDDLVSRMMMRRMLQGFGFEVVETGDGLRAVELLSAADGPRIALIDWMMPGLDGPGVCREIRSRHSDGAYVYILLLTSRQNSEDIVAGLEAGADDYITKPCHPAELNARLATGSRILMLEQKLVDAREEMRYKATHDSLTGLWNRAAILPMIESELERSRRELTVTSLVLCDVDHFKRINDQYGHVAGDAALKEIARRLRDGVRSYDAVGRYGGEEFVMLLRGCGEDTLQGRLENLRLSVAQHPVIADDREINVSVSLGAVASTGGNADLSVAKLLAKADRALYAAKTAGRNCAIISHARQAEPALSGGAA
jgi:two-component system cell cycle response regulator